MSSTALERAFGLIPFRKVSGGVEFLLIQHRFGRHWGFPKGRPEFGERPEETASRECEEEVGLGRQHVKAFFDVQQTLSETYEKQRKRRGPINKVSTYWLAFVEDPNTPIKVQQSEIVCFKWLSPSDALHCITHDETKAMLKTAISVMETLEV
eukprot:110677_1